MDILIQRKLLKFKKTGFNMFLNILNAVIVVLFVSTIFLVFFMLILVSGLAMRAPTSYVGMPFTEYNQYEEKEIQVHLIELDDNYLIYESQAIFRLSQPLNINYLHDSLYGEIIGIYMNDNKIQEDENGKYIIPSGTFELRFTIKRPIYLEEQGEVKAFKLQFGNIHKLTVSNNFRPLMDGDLDGSFTMIHTVDSVGEYRSPIFSSPISKSLVKFFIFVSMYTTLNMTKVILIYIFTKDARLEAKLKRGNV